MKTYKLFSIFLLCICFSTTINAQTTYKGIIIDRNKDDVKCIDIENTNKYPCYIVIQYKTGSKEAPWRDLLIDKPIPPKTKMKPISVHSKIYGLKITYVDIDQPGIVGKIFKAIDEGAEGWVKGKQQAQQNQH